MTTPANFPSKLPDSDRSSSVQSSETDSLEMKRDASSKDKSSTSTVGTTILNALSAVGRFLSFPVRWVWNQLTSSSTPTVAKTVDVAAKTLVQPETKAKVDNLYDELKQHPNLKFSAERGKVVVKDGEKKLDNNIEALITDLGGPVKAMELMEAVKGPAAHNQRMDISNYRNAKYEANAQELHKLLNDNSLTFRIVEDQIVAYTDSELFGASLQTDNPRVVQLLEALGWDANPPKSLTSDETRNLQKYSTIKHSQALSKSGDQQKIYDLSHQLAFHRDVQFQRNANGNVEARNGADIYTLVRLIEDLGGPDKAKVRFQNQDQLNVLERYAAAKKSGPVKSEIPTIDKRPSNASEARDFFTALSSRPLNELTIFRSGSQVYVSYYDQELRGGKEVQVIVKHNLNDIFDQMGGIPGFTGKTGARIPPINLPSGNYEVQNKLILEYQKTTGLI